MSLADLKHGQRTRLIYLDHCLTWRGQARRRDLMQRFGISQAQAALDFRQYRTLAKVAPVYDASSRSYRAAVNHLPLTQADARTVLTTVSDGPGVSLPQPGRLPDPALVSVLQEAAETGQALSLSYVSLEAGGAASQWIAPRLFLRDGERLYLRAFDFASGTDRFFHPSHVLIEHGIERRALAPVLAEFGLEDLPPDEDWNHIETLWLRPRRGLDPDQCEVVRREFGFDGPYLRVELRRALLPLFEDRWELGRPQARLERVTLAPRAEPLAGRKSPPDEPAGQ